MKKTVWVTMLIALVGVAGLWMQERRVRGLKGEYAELTGGSGEGASSAGKVYNPRETKRERESRDRELQFYAGRWIHYLAGRRSAGKMNVEPGDEADFDEGNSLLVETADDPEKRTAALKALRSHLGGITSEDERERSRSIAFESLGRAIGGEDMKSISGWISGANLTDEEKTGFARGVSYEAAKDKTGQWIEWMGANLGENRFVEPVKNLVGEWTKQDYQAAGTWLASASDGPAKQTAVSAYAETVAAYDPQVAGQWAMTLPEGPRRQETLRTIYSNWPAKDPEGAAAFAREHGLD